MPTYKIRFLLVVAWLFFLGSLLVRAGLIPADAGPAMSPTLHAAAWNFLPAQRPIYRPPDNRWLLHYSFCAGAGWN